MILPFVCVRPSTVMFGVTHNQLELRVDLLDNSVVKLSLSSCLSVLQFVSDQSTGEDAAL